MLTTAPFSPERLPALIELFDAAGCPCFCRWWHFSGDDDAWQLRLGSAPEQNSAELERAARLGQVHGVVALRDSSADGEGEAALSRVRQAGLGPRAQRRPSGAGEGEAALPRGRCGGACSPAKEKELVVGWLSLEPAEEVPKMFSRRLYRADPWFAGDRRGVWMVGCLLVHPRSRRQGVARALIAAAIREARARGAVALEALPRAEHPDGPAPARDETLWLGPLTAYLELGFSRRAGTDAHPVMRIELA